MRAWIRVVLNVYEKVETIMHYYDKQIEKYSSFSYSHYDTIDLFDKMQSLVNDKIAVINLRIFYEMIMQIIGEKDFEILLEWCNGGSLEKLANENQTSRSTIYRRLNKIMDKIIQKFNDCGYTKKYFDDRYLQISFTKRLYEEISKKIKKETSEEMNAIFDVPISSNIIYNGVLTRAYI